jgi:hypothetical protein
MKYSILFLSVVCAFRAMGADTIPPELVGAWAPPETKIQDGVLSEGYAIYLNTNGVAMAVTAPPSTGLKSHAVYDATNRVLILTIDVSSSQGFTQKETTSFLYDPKVKTLSPISGPTRDFLTRHGNRIPESVMVMPSKVVK